MSTIIAFIMNAIGLSLTIVMATIVLSAFAALIFEGYNKLKGGGDK